MNYPISEHPHTINGVPGRMHIIHAPQEVRGRMVHRSQKWVSEQRPVDGYGTNGCLWVEIRFDDSRANGHQTFSITATVVTAESRRRRDTAAGGRLHNDIAQVFPELEPLIKWRLCSTDGPMHYVANTVHRASNRDHNGLLKGETRQIINGRTGEPCWVREAPRTEYYDGPQCPQDTVTLEWKPLLRVGEGKERDFAAARSCAIWPQASDEQLSLPKEELTALLEARLPALLTEFRYEMERIGFLWEPQE